MTKSVGFAIGLCVGLVLVVIIFKLANTDRKAATHYDERQALVRGKGYRVGFFAMLICEVVMMALELGEVPIPAPRYLFHFGAIAVGAVALGSYCIWNDCYWGVNNDCRKYIAVFAAVVVLNAVPVVFGIMGGKPWMDYGVNLICFVMLLILVIELIVKAVIDRGEEES